MELLGREPQRHALRTLLERARDGAGGAVVVRAEAGMGKTALIDDAVRAATGFRLARIEGVESEMELAYAGLHRLLLPLLDGIGNLPARQRAALGPALGLADAGADAADRFAVGLATLTLLDAAAAGTPLLCVVDDAHWIDRESLDALALAGRRLAADRVAMVFAARHVPEVGASLDGLPELRLAGLDGRDAGALLRRVLDRHLAPDIAARIIAETDGNPLALIELAREVGADELAHRGLAPEPLPIGRRLEAHFLRQVRSLPVDTQRYLLLAAAEPTEDLAVVLRAAAQLGLHPSAAEPAIDHGFFSRAGPPAFRHSLIRSAVYGGAPASARRRTHAALADATDPTDVDRRAWHRAAATVGVDEAVAGALEAGAARARLRGGYSASGLFLDRAAQLTPERARRSGRVLAAARSHLMGGAPNRARALLDAAALDLDDPAQRAEALRLDGAISFAAGDHPGAATTLMRAARALAPIDVALARATLLHAAAATRFAGSFAPPGGRNHDIAAAARQLPVPDGVEPSAADLLLEGFTTLHLEGTAAAMPVLRRALAALGEADASTEESLLWLEVGSWVASTVGDDLALHSLATRTVEAARDQGAAVHLTNGLLYRAMSNLLGGSLQAARADFTERGELLGAIGIPVDVGRMVIAAWAGEVDEARSEVAAVRRYAAAHRLGWLDVFADWAQAILEIGLGNYGAALSDASQRYEDDSFLVIVGFPNVIEALVRTGRVEEGRAANALFAERATSIGGTLALGLLARTTALLADGPTAEGTYREAIDLLASSRAELQLGRARLLYGEWLRRQARPTDARAQLRLAHQFFEERGVAGFADRARVELEATGERVQRARRDLGARLTPQEAEVARLAADGMTNHEIAEKLFLSASTIDYHLRKVFRKLGITSRRRLRQALG